VASLSGLRQKFSTRPKERTAGVRIREREREARGLLRLEKEVLGNEREREIERGC